MNVPPPDKDSSSDKGRDGGNNSVENFDDVSDVHSTCVSCICVCLWKIK